MSESTRFEFAARYFAVPIRFTTSPQTIRDPNGDRDPIPLKPLSSSSAQKFHFRDTAVYNLSVDPPNHERAFETIWKTWYPRRKIGMDMNPDAFFCRAMKHEEGVGTEVELKGLIGFHEELVRAADEDEEERKRIKAQGGDATLGKKTRRLDGGLEESFRRIFVVLDKHEWEKEGVLVVCREDSVGEFGLGEYVGGEEGNGDEGKGKLLDGGWVAFRKGLAEAVEKVIWDPERKKAEAPTLEHYREKKFGY